MLALGIPLGIPYFKGYILKISKVMKANLVIYLSFFCCLTITHAQINLVPNYSFEELADCELQWGELEKATGWRIIDDSSPDIFNYCSTTSFYIPSDFIPPKTGEGYAGMSPNSLFPESCFAWLTDEIPLGVDIYVAFHLSQNELVHPRFGSACYTNGISLALADDRFDKEVILWSEEILDVPYEWTRLHTCYQATGEEAIVMIGDYIPRVDLRADCPITDTIFTYYYIDDVIIAPFDVVPDTVFLCDDESTEFDISFYEVDIEWQDGFQGGNRIISDAGRYTVMGDLGDCFIQDDVVVIKLEDDLVEEVTKCKEQELTLTAPTPAVWDNGGRGRTTQVNSPGVYQAELSNACGDFTLEFIVTEIDCDINYYVPNVFSPNNDGINDKLEFFFQSDIPFTGELFIFDRWGQQIFSIEGSDALTWDGTYNGQPLNPQVFVWMYKYTTSQDGKLRVISGDVTLVK